MNNFFRALRFAWPYRWRFGLSILCSLVVALMWGANLSAVYPFFGIFFQKQNLHTWMDQQVDKHREEVAKLQERLHTKQVELDRFGQRAGGDPTGHEQARLVAEIRSLTLQLASPTWRLNLCERSQRFVHNYAPLGCGRTLVLVMCLLMLGLIVKGVFSYFGESSVGQVTHLTLFDLKNRLYRHTIRMDLAAFTQDGCSEPMARFTNDIETLSIGIELILGRVIREPLKALVCIGLACWVNWRLTLVLLVLVPVAVALTSTMGRYIKRSTRCWLESMSSIFQILQESFQGIKIVKAFAMEPYEEKRFRDETHNYYRMSMRIVKLEAMLSPLMELAGVGAFMLSLIVGAFLVIGDNDYEQTHILGIRMADAPMDPKSLFMLYAFLAGVSDPGRKLSNVYSRIQRAVAASDRIFALLDRQPAIVDRAAAMPLPRLHQCLELKNVEFSYADSSPIVKGVSLRIPFGETIAIVGPNGCGKTTLLSLIPRFFDPQRGQVLIDGQDIRDIELRSLRQQIGIVTQETVLFDDTFLNNIKYGKPEASRQEVEAAAKKAYAHRFIEELPQGYDTVVGDRAGKLSGGQRQRIALARAILRDPAILILDEATSALDVESESLIQRVLQEFVRNRTTFLITHRMSTLQLANRIVVMDEGHIIDVGVHDELMRRCELYMRLYQIHSAGRLSA